MVKQRGQGCQVQVLYETNMGGSLQKSLPNGCGSNSNLNFDPYSCHVVHIATFFCHSVAVGVFDKHGAACDHSPSRQSSDSIA